MKRFVTGLAAGAMLLMPNALQAQSFGDLLGRAPGGDETRSRAMDAVARSDAVKARTIFDAAQGEAAGDERLPPLVTTQVYDPSNTGLAAQQRDALRTALQHYGKTGKTDVTATATLREATWPFVRRLEQLGRRGGYLVPAGGRATFDFATYCLDSSLPAPTRGETFRLKPTSRLLAPEIAPILNGMLANGAERTDERQGLVWVMRNAYRAGRPIDLTPETARRLEEASPGADAAVARYNARIARAGAVRGLLDSLAPGLRTSMAGFLDNASRLDPRELARSTGQQLTQLESMKPQGQIDPDAAYTTLAPSVVAKSFSPNGGARLAQVEIVNKSGGDYRFEPSEWTATSPRSTQHLALQTPEGAATLTGGGNTSMADADLARMVREALGLLAASPLISPTEAAIMRTAEASPFLH